MINPNIIDAVNLYDKAFEAHLAKNYDEARNGYVEALRYDPTDVPALRSYGVLLADVGEFEEAERFLLLALGQNTSDAITWHALGCFRVAHGRIEEGIECFDRALAIAPFAPQTMRSRADANLIRRNWKAGWTDYQWRFAGATAFSRTDTPECEVITPDMDKILVWSYGGRGDTIHMARYIDWLHSKGLKVYVECQSEMLPLMQRMAEYAYVRPDDYSLPFGKMPHVAFCSLPRLHMMTDGGDGSPFWNGAYLKALNPMKFEKPTIGICFHGNRSWVHDRWRSMSDETGQKLIDAVLSAGYMVAPLMPDMNPGLRTYEDTMNIIAGCDCVISTDTSIAHLSPAMGAKTHVMLGGYPDWRFGIEGGSDWYPGVANVIRQKVFGEWDIEQLTKCLSKQ